MKREIARARPSENNPRRSSVHFHYESEEPSPLPRDDSPSSDAITVKTTHFLSHADSISGFQYPIFPVIIQESRRKMPMDQKQRVEQEQFWSFLEKFGKEANSGSNEDTPDFEEEATVYYRTSTDQRNESKPHLAPESRPQIKHPIRESNGEEEQGATPPNNHSRPEQVRRSYAVAATQTITFPRKKRQHSPLFRPEEQPEEVHWQQPESYSHVSCFRNLTFKEFPHVEESAERRYPVRATRNCGRLKYWQLERIDYSRGGYWVQKPEER